MTRSLQAVAYCRPSVLESAAGGQRLGLETSRGATPSGVEDHPRFFAGFLTSPQVAFAGLLAVADVAAARYYQRQLRASLDPVVTGNGDRLRFESFSGCCGVYARLDVLDAGLDGGEAGEAVHLAVAYGLGARHPEDRLAAVDALLVLAARGQLDAARLGTDLGELARRGAVKPSRLVESARTAAATGANATIWEMLRHTLPVLLADLETGAATAPARGLADLLAVAAECAERTGAREELPHLARAADRRGSSRLATQARRLRSALAEGVAA